MAPLVVLQIIVVVVGTAWCLVLVSILCFGGWYTRTHPATGNDRVMVRLARLLQFLTFGMTDCPFPEPGFHEDTSREAAREQETPAGS